MFRTGILAATAGVTLWILFQMQILNSYPRFSHGAIMFFGFFQSFICGFLMTAVPRMTGAQEAKNWEVWLAAGLALAQVVLAFFNLDLALFHFQVTLLCIQQLALFSFVVRRFWTTRRIPFEGFLFVPTAFIMSFIGIIMSLVSSSGSTSGLFYFSGRIFVLNLILGVGSRLIPVVSRIPFALAPDQASQKTKWTLTFIWVALINLVLTFNFYFESMLTKALVLVVITAFCIQQLALLKRPSTWSFLSIGLKLSLGFILISLALTSIFPEYQLALQHLEFISGYAMLTLMIATRVSLAHSGAGTDFEFKADHIMPVIGSLIAAAWIRAMALDNPMSSLILISALVFIFGILYWLFRISFKKASL